MLVHSHCRLLGLLAAAVVASIGDLATEARADGDSNAEILAELENGQVDWKVRIRSLVGMAKASSESVPMLVDAIQDGTPAQREFAAQALGMILDPATRPALQRALKDGHRGVRGFVQRALRTMGPAGQEPSPEAESIRATVANFDLAQIDSARVGQVAPEFALVSADGKPFRLSQFRGKTVVLEFNGAYD